jgi:hypothetical protein
MAATTLTWTKVASWREKNKRYAIYDVLMNTGDWATAGIAMTPSDVGFSYRIDALIDLSGVGYVHFYDSAAGKLRIFYADNNGGADGPLITYPASAMVAHTARVLAIGW